MRNIMFRFAPPVILLSYIFLSNTFVGCDKLDDSQSPVIIGRIENAVLQDGGLKLKARIDTGAGVSSINAKIIKIEKSSDNQGERIMFEVTDESGHSVVYKRKIIEWTEIKGKGTNVEMKRPVVIMDFCLGGKLIEGRVNLTDRQAFLYPLLIGRNILKAGDFLIDPAKTFMEHPGCKYKKSKK